MADEATSVETKRYGTIECSDDGVRSAVRLIVNDERVAKVLSSLMALPAAEYRIVMNHARALVGEIK